MTFNKMRNLLMIAAVSIVFFAPLSILALNQTMPSFSVLSSFGQDKVRYLDGATQDNSVKKSLTLSAFMEGKLQDELEKELGNSIPGKYLALLGYSASERIFIEISNVLLGYSAYPAHYGTDIVFLPENNALAEYPDLYNNETLNKLVQISKQLASLTTEYPDKHFCVIVADISNNASVQPAMSYSNVTIDTSVLTQKLGEACHDINNITFYGGICSDLEAYYENYYTTDHHWRGWGALKAYNEAVRLMGKEQLIDVNALKISQAFEKEQKLNGQIINGSYSRSSLMLLNELANEPSLVTKGINIRNIEYFPDAKQTPPQIICQNSSDIQINSLPMEFNFYETWYGGSMNMVIENFQNSNANALIIGDSYSASFAWIASQTYSLVTLYQDMRGNAQPIARLRERINGSNSDYVFIVASTQNFIKTFKKNANYFE